MMCSPVWSSHLHIQSLHDSAALSMAANNQKNDTYSDVHATADCTSNGTIVTNHPWPDRHTFVLLLYILCRHSLQPCTEAKPPYWWYLDA
jgi:hypothetical protein